MRKLVMAAAVALIGTAAQAEVHELRFGGSTWRIEISEKCRDIACIRVSERDRSPPRARKAAKPVKGGPVATAAPKATAPKVATPTVPVVPIAPPAPAAVAAAPESAALKSESKIEPQPAGDPRLSLVVVEDATPAPPVAAPEPRIEPTIAAEPSPLGLWLTEKGEGRVRIEPCGSALCGHADGKPEEKILINMRATQKNRWQGKINDLRAGGTYMAQMSLTKADALRIEGCAFGGLFCGSQTWTRAQ